ncbi:hypothetical protein VTO42DRAFT_2540 [Malbranchea cinnamomea]
MDSSEREHSHPQSAYPDPHSASPGIESPHLRLDSQYSIVHFNNVTGNSASGMCPDDDYGGESTRRKRRRVEEALDSGDQNFEAFEYSSQSEITPEDEDEDEDETEEDQYYVDDSGMTFGRRPGRGRFSRPSSTFGGRGGKGVKRGPRKPLEPSPEFKKLHTEATLAFIDSDYDRAISLVKQAIQINPEIFAAHSLLSEIFLAQGHKDKALAALFSGAHTRPKDPSVWMKVAELIRERGGEDQTSALQDVVYCYSRVIEIDQKNHDARFQRAAANRELGHNGKAAQDYERILKDLPHNTTALRSLAEVCIDLNDVDKAIERYNESISYFTSLNSEEAPEFSWSDVNVYTDLYAYQKNYRQGIFVLRSLARWLLGRKDDDQWDIVQDDDREWDGEDDPRRTQTPWFRQGQYPLESYGYGLPLELRVKLGIFRLKLGPEYRDEALYHLEWLEPDDPSPTGKLFDYGDLFRESADALKEAGLHAEALRFYTPLQYNQEYADTNLYMDIADCYAACGTDEEAESCYLTVVEYDRQNIEARVKLAKYYEKMGMLEQAMKYITEAAEIGRSESFPRRGRRYGNRAAQLAREFRSAEAGGRARGNRAGMETTRASGPISLMTGPIAADRQRAREPELSFEERANNVQYLYGKMQELKPVMRAGDEASTEDWLDIADALLREFRSNRVFFPVQRRMLFLGYSREAQRKAGRYKPSTLFDEIQDIAERLQAALGTTSEIDPESIPTDYCGISFDDWLDIFLEYALILAGQGLLEEAYDTLGAAADASIWYHSKPSSLQIYTCWLTCALQLNDEETLTTIARWFMKEYQFVTDVYRLFSTLSHLAGDPRKSLFHSPASIKFILRQIKAVDYSLPSDFSPSTPRPQIPPSERAMLTTKDETGQPIPAKDMDISLLLLYGHILYAGTSYTNALNYFFRAYALDPKNPAVLLSIALSYIHHALKRQAENRHYMIMQGMSFMEEYRAVREQSTVPQERQEMEFNFARVYHMLGLAHLAIQRYERCLSLGDEIKSAREQTEKSEKHSSGWSEDFSREAAYALQCLYAFSGEMESARQVTEQWLVI